MLSQPKQKCEKLHCHKSQGSLIALEITEGNILIFIICVLLLAGFIVMTYFGFRNAIFNNSNDGVGESIVLITIGIIGTILMASLLVTSFYFTYCV